MFQFMENWKILDLMVVENEIMKGIFSIQIPDSPPPQQGALESIRGLTVLCTVYRLYLFLSLFLSFSITRPSPLLLKKLSFGKSTQGC